MNAAEFDEMYQVIDDGVPMLKLSLGAVFYLGGEIDTERRRMSSVVELLWPLLDGHLESFQTTNMKKQKKVRDKAKEIVLQMLSAPSSPFLDFVTVDNRMHIDQAPDYCLELALAGYRKSGYILFRFPHDALKHETLIDLCRSVMTEIRISHGYAGFTLAYSERSERAVFPKSKFYAIGMRHPGIDLPSAGNTSFVGAHCIKRVNWMTLLGERLSQRAGQLSGLEGASHIVRHSNEHGVLIQAGSAPQIGDTNRGDRCEAYRVVGRALESLRCRNHPAFIPEEGSVGGSVERTENWLASLDK